MTGNQDRVKDFYTQTGVWWGEDPQTRGMHEESVKTFERLRCPGVEHSLDLGAGLGRTVAALASRSGG